MISERMRNIIFFGISFCFAAVDVNCLRSNSVEVTTSEMATKAQSDHFTKIELQDNIELPERNLRGKARKKGKSKGKSKGNSKGNSERKKKRERRREKGKRKKIKNRGRVHKGFGKSDFTKNQLLENLTVQLAEGGGKGDDEERHNPVELKALEEELVSEDKQEITTVDVDEQSNKNMEQQTEHEEKKAADDKVEEELTVDREKQTITAVSSKVNSTPFMENNVFGLDVRNGIGSGIYPSHTRIKIMSPSCPKGESFLMWVIRSGDPEISDERSATTILTTPASDASVQAHCTIHLNH